MNGEDAGQGLVGCQPEQGVQPFVKACRWLPKPPSDDNWFEDLPSPWTFPSLKHALLRALQTYSVCVGEDEAKRVHAAGGPAGHHGYTSVTTIRSVGNCRRHLATGRVDVDVVFDEIEKKLDFVGLQTCKSNSCTACAPAKVVERTLAAKEIMLASVKAGHGLYPFAATLRHGLWSDLRTMVDGQRRAWCFVSGHRWMKDGGCALPPGVERIGYAMSWEHTFGLQNGHHPHANGVWMLSRPLSEEFRKVGTGAQAIPTGVPLTAEEQAKVDDRSRILDELGQIPKWKQRGGRAAYLRRELVRNEDWLVAEHVESEFFRFERCLSELWIKGVVKFAGEDYRPGRGVGFAVQPAARLMKLAADIGSADEALVDCLVLYLFKEATSLSFEAASGGALKRANKGNYSPFHLAWAGMYHGDWSLISAYREIEQVYKGKQRWGVLSRDLRKKVGLDDAEPDEAAEEIDKPEPTFSTKLSRDLWIYSMNGGRALGGGGLPPLDVLVRQEFEKDEGLFWECAAAWLNAVRAHCDVWPVSMQWRILVNGLLSGNVPPDHARYWPAGRSPPVLP